MLTDLRGPYYEALKNVEDGTMYVAHVGLYTDRTVIILHTDRKTKEVKVIDCTDNPTEQMLNKNIVKTPDTCIKKQRKKRSKKII